MEESESRKERPLLTFAVFSHDQERFIRESVAGAFAQTYSPLQIILTDDCSSDRSFEIMSEMASSYRGPHDVLLNRNPKNLGEAGHINRVMEMAKGDLVLIADGDDVSLDVRAERSYMEWSRSGGSASQIYGDAITIDAEGREFGRWLNERIPSHARTLEEAVARGTVGITGCTHMFTRKCFDVFGPLEGLNCCKDVAVSFRALFLGEVRYMDEPLVRYRIHGGNVSVEPGGRSTLAFRIRMAGYHENAYSSWLHDTRTALAKGLITEERAERIQRSLLLRQYWQNVEKQYCRSKGLQGLWTLLSSACEAANIGPAMKIVDRKRRSRV